MNNLSYKQKSFLYSLSIHSLIILSVFSILFFTHNKTQEKRTLVHLSAFHCTIPIKKPIIKQAKIIKKVTATKKVKKIVPIKKKIVKKKPALKTVIVNKTPKIEPKIVEVLHVETKVVKKQKPAIIPAQEPTFTKTVEEKVVQVVIVSDEKKYIDENLVLINKLIKKYLIYPRVAKKRGKQGKVYVSFTINKNGEISEIHTSGEVSRILKKSAIKTIKKASSSFPHPQTMLSLSIPISYKLR